MDIGDLVTCDLCHALPMRPDQLGQHKRRKHQVSSDNPASIRRRLSRERERGVTRPQTLRPPPPEIPGVPVHRIVRQRHGLDAGDVERLRKWVLYAIHTTFVPHLDVPAAIVVDAIALLCSRNFMPPPAALRNVALDELDSARLEVQHRVRAPVAVPATPARQPMRYDGLTSPMRAPKPILRPMRQAVHPAQLPLELEGQL